MALQLIAGIDLQPIMVTRVDIEGLDATDVSDDELQEIAQEMYLLLSDGYYWEALHTAVDNMLGRRK